MNLNFLAVKYKVLFGIGLIGAVVLVIGVVLPVVLPSIVKAKLREALRLVEGSEVYTRWVEPEFPIYKEFYFFNVTNHKTAFFNGTKPILQQLGPYTFREYRKKVNISYNNIEDTISYNEIKWWVYLPSKSNGSLSDKVTNLNVPYLCIGLSKDKKLSFSEKITLPWIIRNFNASVFVTKTVDEFLFKGYQDPMMSYLHNLTGEEYLPNGMFGYLYGKNYTSDGTFSIFTGISNQDKFMEIDTWNKSTNTKLWDSEYCNMINGTDGSKFKSYLSKNDTIYLFDTELCRSIHLRYEKDETIHGIPAYRFSLPFSMLASADVEPDNKCFCSKDIGCLKRGAFIAPLFTTLPHFYNADESYYEAIIGVDKSKELHDTFVDIEPTTGYIVRTKRRGQINLALRPMSDFKDFKDLPDMLFPLFWVDENFVWPRDFADSFSNRVFKPQEIVGVLSNVFIVLGVITFIFFISFTVVKLMQKKSPEIDHHFQSLPVQ